MSRYYMYKKYVEIIPLDRWSVDHFWKKHWPNSALRYDNHSLYLGCQSSNSGLFQNYSLYLKIHGSIKKKIIKRHSFIAF